MWIQSFLVAVVLASLGLTTYVGIGLNPALNGKFSGKVQLAQTSGTWPQTQADCTAKSYIWCPDSHMSQGGWCQQTGACPATTTEACAAQGGKWCTDSSMSKGGWCMTGGGTCPAKDSATCSGQGGKWCVDSSMSNGGWCQSSGDCPVNTESACTAAGRQWCRSAAGAAAGWCAPSGQTCGGDTGGSTCPTGYVQCPASGSNPAGCYVSCSNVTLPPSCSSGQIYCPAVGTSPAGCYTTCPTATPSPIICPSGQVHCPAGPGYPAGCYTSCSSTTPVPDPNKPTPESCKSQGRFYCTSPGSTSGWCSTVPCTETECKTANKFWCPPPPSGSPTTSQGWCSDTISSCPAYNSADCAARNGKWCKSSAMANGVDGYCMTGGGNCPANTEADCLTQNGKWCKSVAANATGSNGWCMQGPGTCPAHDEPSCKVQGGSWCPPSGGASMGWCATPPSTCPTATPGQCSTGQIYCPAVGESPAGCYVTCPVAKPVPEPTCPAGQMRCPASGSRPAGCYAWCTVDNPPGPEPKPIPPGPSPESCKAQNMYFCTSSGTGGNPWCSTYPCNEADCKAAQKRWCPPAPMPKNSSAMAPSQGWCTDSNNTCPAYNEIDCVAQRGKWCKNSSSDLAMGGMEGWCMTGGGSCPAHDEASCKSQGGSWCQPSSGGRAWCATAPSTCPDEQKDKKECVSKGGLWCQSQGGGFGWCATGGTRCPANNPEECSARNGKWCKPAPNMTSATMTSNGWCSEGDWASCPVYTQEDCTAQAGVWCVPTSGWGNGWCQQGKNPVCPSGSKPAVPGPKDPEIPPVPPRICPLASIMQCRDNEESISYKNADGCIFYECRPKAVRCPEIRAYQCKPGYEGVSFLDKEGCQQFDCKPVRCPGPPPDNQCPSGWKPLATAAGCPVYECRNTDHERMEECVRRIVGDQLFEKMKKDGVPPSKDLMDKINASCFVISKPIVVPPDPDQPRPPVQCPLAQMKREFERGVKGELKRVEKQVAKLRRQGADVPASFLAILSQLTDLVDKAAKAKDCEEIFDHGRSMPELMRELHDQLQGIERLAKASGMVKKFNQLLADLEKQWKKVSRGLKADIRKDFEASYQEKIADFKAAVEAIKSAAADEDPDKIVYASGEAYERYRTALEVIEHTRLIKETNVILLRVRSEVRTADRMAARLGREGEDVADLKEAISMVNDSIKEVNANRSKCSRKLDDDCLQIFEEFMSITSAFRQIYNEFLGSQEFNKVFGLGDLVGGIGDFKVLEQLEDQTK